MTQTSNPPLPDHPADGASRRPMKDNALRPATIGLATRFGPDWPGKRCLAKTRRGTECQRPAIMGAGRCRLHDAGTYAVINNHTAAGFLATSDKVIKLQDGTAVNSGSFVM